MLKLLPSFAKVNLSLAITGRRPDGFHDLTSLAACIALADTLEAVEAPMNSEDSLTSDAEWLDCGPQNLVLKAAATYRAANPVPAPPVAFKLTKRIPAGAGLGGGSSNAATTLRLLNQMSRQPLPESELPGLAAQLGSDVPLFLHTSAHRQSDGSPAGRLIVMRGRGEVVELLDTRLNKRLRHYQVALFKPSFPIATPWAYQQLAVSAPASYLPQDKAEELLSRFIHGQISLPDFLFNSFEACVSKKYLALPALLSQLRDAGYPAMLSGSGSACFALTTCQTNVEQLREMITEAWGAEAWLGIHPLML